MHAAWPLRPQLTASRSHEAGRQCTAVPEVREPLGGALPLPGVPPLPEHAAAHARGTSPRPWAPPLVWCSKEDFRVLTAVEMGQKNVRGAWVVQWDVRCVGRPNGGRGS